jgi:transcriptional regulator with XRE-family HTH domain
MIKNRVQEFRELAGRTIEQLADQASMTTYTLRAIELGQTELRANALVRLAEALCVRPADLVVSEPSDKEIVESILRKVRAVRASEENIGIYSLSEQIAVALVLNKPNLIPNGSYTILEAVDRLGPDWTAAALNAQRLLDTDQ